MAGYKYNWKCPNCGTDLQLKMRATQTKRKCPHCGTPVTPEEIDNQANLNAIGGLIGSLLLIGVILLCCKGCPPNSNQPQPNPPTATPIPTPVNSAANQRPAVQNSTQTNLSPDLSTPESAVKTHFTALKYRDAPLYMKTLSRKYLREYEDLGQKVQLWEDKKTKVKRSAQEVVVQMFLNWNDPHIEEPAVIRYSSDISVYGEKISGRNATVNIVVMASQRTVKLTKEGNEWKLDDFPLGNW